MTRKSHIQRIETDDFHWVSPIFQFYTAERETLQNPNWLLERTEDDFHSLIAGKNGGHIWVATNESFGSSIIRGIITLEKGRLDTGDLSSIDPSLEQHIDTKGLRLSFRQAANNGQSALIGCFLTDGAYRQNGLAQELLKAALNRAINDGFCCIGAHITCDNTQAIKTFAEKAGFVIIGQGARVDGTPRYAMGAVVQSDVPALVA